MSDGITELPVKCVNCHCDIDPEKPKHRVKKSFLSSYSKTELDISVNLCQLCFGMIEPVYKRSFFVNAEVEFKQEKYRRDRLKFGADYFTE